MSTTRDGFSMALFAAVTPTPVSDQATRGLIDSASRERGRLAGLEDGYPVGYAEGYPDGYAAGLLAGGGGP